MKSAPTASIREATGERLSRKVAGASRSGRYAGVGLDEAAGRTAYLAGLHAAQALIFESVGRTFKRHSTVQREFRRMVRDERRVDAELRVFLRRTYNPKAIADYETGPGSHVSAESAQATVQTALRFVECVTSLMPPTNGPAPPRAPATPDTPAP